MSEKKSAGAMTPEQEEFARIYVECGDAEEAFKRVYGVRGDMNHFDLLRNPNVIFRINNLRYDNDRSIPVTVDSLTTALREAYAVAKENGQGAAMTSAIMGLAKLHGLIVDKASVTQTNFVISADPIGDGHDGAGGGADGWLDRHGPED